jgi:hypothetical protein
MRASLLLKYSCSSVLLIVRVPCLRCGDGVEAIKTRRVKPEQFVLGDEDDEEQPPPGYDEAVNPSALESGSRKDSVGSGENNGATPSADEVDIVDEPLKHRIQKGETIRSIANRYAMDVSPQNPQFPLPSLADISYVAIYLNQTQRPSIHCAYHTPNSYPDEAMDHVGAFFPPHRGTAAGGTDRGRNEQMGRDRGR